jgi:ATP-dependent Lon protease
VSCEEGADFEELAKKIEEAACPRMRARRPMAELKKLKMMSPMSAEATVVRSYIETGWCRCPGSKKSKVKKNLAKAETCWNEDHYGLDKVKERILEYLAVQATGEQAQGAHPVPGRASRCGQDLAGAVHRQGDRPQVCAHGPGWRA